MEMRKRNIAAGLLAGVLMIGGQHVWASTVHYNDSSATGGSEEWQQWVADWNQTASDFTNVSLTPGGAASELNFAWYSEGTAPTPVVYFGTDKDNLQAWNGAANGVDPALTGGKAYSYNYVTVDGLKENTTYYYSVEKSGVRTPAQEYKTGSFENVKILYVGDPQVGASKGQPQGEGKLSADSGAANTAARNDGFAWDRTMDKALEQNPDLNFVNSACEQVHNTGKPTED